MKLNSVPKSHSLLCSESSIFFLNIYTITFFFFFFQAEDGIRDKLVTGFRRVLFRSRHGRRPILLLSLAVTTACYALIATALARQSLGLLALGLVIAGLAEANVATAQSAI